MGVAFFPFTLPHRKRAFNLYFQYINKISPQSKTNKDSGVPCTSSSKLQSFGDPLALSRSRLRGWRKEAKAKAKGLRLEVKIQVKGKVKSSGLNTHVTLEGYPTPPAHYAHGQGRSPETGGAPPVMNLVF